MNWIDAHLSLKKMLIGRVASHRTSCLEFAKIYGGDSGCGPLNVLALVQNGTFGKNPNHHPENSIPTVKHASGIILSVTIGLLVASLTYNIMLLDIYASIKNVKFFLLEKQEHIR